MTRLILCLPCVALVACTQPSPEVGRALYAEACAACHGADARGNGPLAAQLTKTPPDLTLLSARNSGVFPRTYVMGVIDGYTRRVDPHSAMPEFGPEMQAGNLVLVDTGDGIMTPTPEKLVALADYLQTVQR